VNIGELKHLKGVRKVTMLTAYDHQIAKIIDRAGLDMILVGDSLGMVIRGYSDTKHVTMEDMVRHTQAVARGAESALVVVDMPIGSYGSPEDALKNARRITESVGALTIGIGAGLYCDGQVLVINDLLGMDRGYSPKHLKVYVNLNSIVTDAVQRYMKDVRSGRFPDDKHSFH